MFGQQIGWYVESPGCRLVSLVSFQAILFSLICLTMAVFLLTDLGASGYTLLGNGSRFEVKSL